MKSKQLRAAIRFCDLAAWDHTRRKRQYAHTMHYTDVICVTPDFWQLPEGHLLGILAHEVGHLLSSAEEHTEEEADENFTTHFGIFITYRDSIHGKRLQFLSPAWARQFLKTFHVDRVKKYIELKVK